MRKHGLPPMPTRGSPVQVFTYGPLEFNVSRAAFLAGNTRKYRPETRWPAHDWVGPNIDVDHAYVERSDLRQPVIFATIVLDGAPQSLLIDGNHRVLKALHQQAPVQAVTLDLEDTLKILSGPPAMLRRMQLDGQQLGLLKPTA